MLGSAILDVAIGLVFVYLLLGLLVSAGTELIAAGLSWRADNLRQGLQRLLNPALASAFYDHPLISKLSKSGRGPSYIPAETFALVLVDMLANLPPAHPDSARDLASLIDNVPDLDVRRVLKLLLEEAGQDGDRLKKNIEDWFNNSMNRVSGWYKRKIQVVNVALAVSLAVAVNADSLLILRSLANDSALRAALVAQAQELVKQGPPPSGQAQPGTDVTTALGELDKRWDRLSNLGIPVGWSDGGSQGLRQWPGWRPGDKPISEWGAVWLSVIRQHFLGWLLTALAASLGGPFWFDLLSKIITIRSSGPKPKPELNTARP